MAMPSEISSHLKEKKNDVFINNIILYLDTYLRCPVNVCDTLYCSLENNTQYAYNIYIFICDITYNTCRVFIVIIISVL